MRILVADDDAKASGLLVQGLKSEGYAVDLASDGDEATWLAETNPYDALVLDVMMPAKDGFSVVRHLRKKGILTPVIFVTARGEVEDRVRGLDAGGDDYLAKPFSLAELLARLRATLRRQRPQASNTLRLADLEMDLLSRKVRRGGQDIVLTNREFALLEFLLVNSPRPVSKMAIVEHVWDQHFDSQTNVVNVYVNYLRNKIDLPGSKPLLHTVRGVGFALTDE
jgi:DNA-binding response OmpR family regulator